MQKNDWKKEMDALVRRTTANWEKTGLRSCRMGVTGSANLAASEGCSSPRKLVVNRQKNQKTS